MTEQKEKLFSEFSPITTAQWMEKVTADLKGADFAKKLVWKTNEGFSVNPMYRAEDIEGMPQTMSMPGEFPYVRGTKQDNNWAVRQDIEVCADCLNEVNTKAITLTKKGVTSFGFIIDRDVVSKETLETLLQGINLENIEVNFKTCAMASVKLTGEFVAYVQNKKYDVTKVVASLNFDPIGRMIARGKKMDDMYTAYTEVIKASMPLPFFKVIAINPVYFNNAGSYIYQELGYALAWGNDLLVKLSEAGLDVDVIAKKIKFNFGVGSNYFMEIAKFRAARMLWANIVMAYAPKCKCTGCEPNSLCFCAPMMRIHAETSQFNMTVYDAHVNLLRSQTEAMSASLAGVDSLTILPFDYPFTDSSEFSERIARNQQLLLKEESHFDKVADPSAGSYYIETLTASIAQQAWNLFLEVEENGGFIAEAEANNIQIKVNASGTARRQAVAARRESLLGTNQFPNFNEKALNKISESDCSCGCSCGKENMTLNLNRAAAEFEELRLATEKATKRPKAFMLTIGNLAMRLARAQFSCNFFGCAGYEVVDNLGFDTPEAGIKAALEQGADIVVLCSSDDEYTDIAPAAFKALAGQAEFVVAGAPATMDELKAQGITQFINVRSNVLETLKSFNAKLLK